MWGVSLRDDVVIRAPPLQTFRSICKFVLPKSTTRPCGAAAPTARIFPKDRKVARPAAPTIRSPWISTFIDRPHEKKPTLEYVNQVRQKYYPEIPPLQAEAGQTNVTKAQLDSFADTASAKYLDEYTKASQVDQNHDWKTFATFFAGGGETKKYETMLNELAAASNDQPTTFMQDRVADDVLLVDGIQEKVAKMFPPIKDWVMKLDSKALVPPAVGLVEILESARHRVAVEAATAADRRTRPPRAMIA